MEGAGVTSSVRTNQGKGENVPRRFWTTKEEETLLVALEVLYAEGVKLDGSLRGGYMLRLAKMITEMLPGCGIEHKHVKSKLAVWRRTHTAIVTILRASGGSGFTLDTINNMIIADKPDTWSEQEKVYKEGVKLVRGRSFPWLNRWNILFGTDRATGNGSVDVADAVNELQTNSKHDGSSSGQGIHDSNTPRSKDAINLDDEGDDATSMTPPSLDGAESRKSSSKRRRSSSLDASHIKNLMGELMESARDTLGGSVAHFTPGASGSNTDPSSDIAAKQDGLYDALISLPDLSKDVVMWAAHHLAKNHGDLRAFYGMPVNVRGTFVISLMHFSN